MRFLGIDYGQKRIGVSLSDEGGTVAFPHEALENNEVLVERIVDIVRENEVAQIVLGESRDFSGKPNPVQSDIEAFAETVRSATGKHIVLEPEFLTSAEARRAEQVPVRRGAKPPKSQKPSPVDVQAATLILQSFLDKRRNHEAKNPTME